MAGVIQNTSVERLCQTCGYDLRGIESNRCPECGETFDLTDRTGANIPWLRRRAIGSWRAYWQTVAMGMLHPIKLSRNVWNADLLDPKSAAKFRTCVVIEVVISYLAAFYAMEWSWAQHLGTYHSWVAITSGAITATVLSIFLIGATDSAHAAWAGIMSSDGAMWRRALMHYACAPLAISPVVMVCLLISVRFNPFLPIALLALGAMICWWWFNCVLMMYEQERSLGGGMARAIVLPLVWAMMAFGGALICAALCSIAAIFIARFVSR